MSKLLVPSNISISNLALGIVIFFTAEGFVENSLDIFMSNTQNQELINKFSKENKLKCLDRKPEYI
jgi:hypothetical protein